MKKKLQEVKRKFVPNQTFAFHTLSLSEKLGDCTPLFYGISKEDVEWLIHAVEEQQEELEAWRNEFMPI